MRITITDAEGMFGRAARAAAALGADTTGWRLEPGSRTNGVTWKLSTGGTRAGVEGSRLRLGGWDNEFLGWTAAEAYNTLHALACAWEAAAEWLAPLLSDFRAPQQAQR